MLMWQEGSLQHAEKREPQHDDRLGIPMTRLLEAEVTPQQGSAVS